VPTARGSSAARKTRSGRRPSGEGGPQSGAPLRIAHAYGNTRERLETALEAAVDAIELDVWYRGGEIWVRHEKRLGPLPILVDKRMRGHALPPLSLPLGKRWYVRLDFKRLKLDDVLTMVAGKKGLLVDLKGAYRAERNLDFARAVVRTIRKHGAESWVSVCGQFWPVLDDVRREAPDLEVRYSVERVYQWEKFMRLVGADERVRRVCIEHRFLNEERTRFIEDRGVNLFCWTVDNPDEAQRLVAAGADGIISNDLGLLAKLRDGDHESKVEGAASRPPVGDQVDGGRLEGGDDGRAGSER
jgi:glycerophosphoryl diester phosphodiesterase